MGLKGAFKEINYKDFFKGSNISAGFDIITEITGKYENLWDVQNLKDEEHNLLSSGYVRYHFFHASNALSVEILIFFEKKDCEISERKILYCNMQNYM